MSNDDLAKSSREYRNLLLGGVISGVNNQSDNSDSQDDGLAVAGLGAAGLGAAALNLSSDSRTSETNSSLEKALAANKAKLAAAAIPVVALTPILANNAGNLTAGVLPIANGVDVNGGNVDPSLGALYAAPIAATSSLGPGGRLEKRNGTIENSFKIWAIWAFIVFLLSMLVGICGLCCCCPFINDTTFWDFFY